MRIGFVFMLIAPVLLTLCVCVLTGSLFRASQFLAEELPIRLAHRVQELDSLPDGLNEMPSVKRVLDWYAQSFEVCTFLQPHFFSRLGGKRIE